MPVELYCGEFQPWLETECIRRLRQDLQYRKNPLREQALVVVPTHALRRRLLQALSTGGTGPLFGVNILSLNHLCLEIAASAVEPGQRMISDRLFFSFALYQIARTTGNTRFGSFRICAALYQTLRDLADGSIHADLLSDVVSYIRQEPELRGSVDVNDLEDVAALYTRLGSFLEDNGILNLQNAAAIAASRAEAWLERKSASSIYMYGFYDSTQSQFDVLETAIRAVVRNDGLARIFFPFRVDGNRLLHPAQFAQPFYEHLFSLCSSLTGDTIHEPVDIHPSSIASAGIERILFVSDPSEDELKRIRDRHRIEVFNAAGKYDEAWGVAKRILNLVRFENVPFDRILVISRTAGDDLLPLAHVFSENRIPCTLNYTDGGVDSRIENPAASLAFLPFARFALVVVQAREARLNHSSLFEFLSSPFLTSVTRRDLENIRKLLDELVIKNWDDWDRLRSFFKYPIPDLPAFERDNEAVKESLRTTARDLFALKELLLAIPENATLPGFASALRETLRLLCGTVDETVTAPVLALLNRLAGHSSLNAVSIPLSEFSDLLKQYFQVTGIESQETEPVSSRVTVGDIMQLRGCTADFVFLIGLNKDLFPRRAQEDPFLPDRVRLLLRSLTGAGPSIRKGDRTGAPSLLPLKEGTDEELLLFSLALRSAGKQLFLSYQRANEKGQKKSPSTYLDELLRLLTGTTSESGKSVVIIPKHQPSKFKEDGPPVLPTPDECAMLTSSYAPEEIIRSIYGLPSNYVESVHRFGLKLNSGEIEASKELDGCILRPEAMWKAVLSKKPSGAEGRQLQLWDPPQEPGEMKLRLSYSRFKSYLQCPFQFYSGEILQLQDSPRDADETDHDITPFMKGRMAEDVVKEALSIIHDKNCDLNTAVSAAADKMSARYSAILPPLLLDLYTDQFRRAAQVFLRYLQKQGFNLKRAETPGYADLVERPLVPADQSGAIPAMIIRGIPDLVLPKSGPALPLIGELKWGSRSVGNTVSSMFENGEAQFCIYPALMETKRGTRFDFQYFRLDAFFHYGSADEIFEQIEMLMPKKISAETAVRIFGERVDAASGSQEAYLERSVNHARAIQAGQFRIIKEPSLFWNACRFCRFTQLCRKTHTATLLRSKRAER